MPKGNYGALRYMQPIKTNFGDIAREQEQINAQKRAEKRQTAKEDKADQRYEDEKQTREERQLATDLARMKTIYTGVNSLDEGLGKGVQGAAERVIKVDEMLRNDKSLSKDQRLKLRIEKQNLLNYSDKLSAASKKYNDKTIATMKGIADRTLSESMNKDLVQNLSNTIGKSNFAADFDEAGNPIFWQDDLNGKTEEVSYQSFLDGHQMKNAVLGFDHSEWVGEMGKILGTQTTQIEGASVKDGGIGYYGTVKDKQVKEEALKTLDAEIKSLIGEDSKDASDRGKGIWQDHYKQTLDNYNYDTLYKKLYNSALGSKDTERTETRNDADRRADNKVVADAEKTRLKYLADEEKKKVTARTKSTVFAWSDSNGDIVKYIPIKSGSKASGQMETIGQGVIMKTPFEVEIVHPTSQKENDLKVTSIFYNESDKNLYWAGTTYQKTPKEKVGSITVPSRKSTGSFIQKIPTDFMEIVAGKLKVPIDQIPSFISSTVNDYEQERSGKKRKFN